MDYIDKLTELFLNYFYIWLFLAFIIWAILMDVKNSKREKDFSEWEETREKAFNFYWKCCSNCWIYKHLQVHHKIPKSMWWSDDISNLIVLCKECHEKEHWYKFDNSQINSWKTASNKMKIINIAISKNEKLTIVYNNTFRWEITKRYIQPIELYKWDYKTKSWKNWFHWTVRAYCYLRNWERNFQIRKIKDIII